MDNGILLYQFLTFLIGIVAGTMAFCVFLVEAAPLTRKFLIASQIFNLYYFLVGLAAYSIRVAGFFSDALETSFSLANCLLFALLVPTWTAFVLELLQKPFVGPWRAVSGVISALGIVFPLAVFAIPLDAGVRLLTLRYGLYGGYAVLVLFYCVALSLAAHARRTTVADPWKRSTLDGTNILMWCGFPLFLVDALWPWFQVQAGWLPRAFNFQGLFLAAFGIFFASRWAVQLKTLSAPKEKPHLYDESKVRLVDLTDREREVFDLLFQERSNQDIVAQLGISLGTAKNHVYHIFQKTGASSRRELVNMFRAPW